MKDMETIGIIGGADGPMAIFVAMKLAPHLLEFVVVGVRAAVSAGRS